MQGFPHTRNNKTFTNSIENNMQGMQRFPPIQTYKLIKFIKFWKLHNKFEFGSRNRKMRMFLLELVLKPWIRYPKFLHTSQYRVHYR